MATRPVYVSTNSPPFFDRIDVEFKFHAGFSVKQKQANIKELHSNFSRLYPDRKLLRRYRFFTRAKDFFLRLALYEIFVLERGFEICLRILRSVSIEKIFSVFVFHADECQRNICDESRSHRMDAVFESSSARIQWRI